MRLALATGLLFVAHLLLLTSFASAQVPQLINYQGRVAVGGTNFTGSGQFRFALVNAAGTTTYWSNDGTNVGGSPVGGTQPTAAVSLTVTNGLYSVLMGDAALANMTAIPSAVFNNSDVRLRVWFNDGTNGVQLLTPDQRIAAVGYALMADGVKAGGVTTGMIANGAVGSAQIASGAVTGSNIATGTITGNNLAGGAAAANLAASGQSGVGSGGLILSPTENPALLAQGYIKVGTTTTTDSWTQRSNGSAPAARTRHAAVWTGTEMIVWGGFGASGYLNDGGRYNPAANVWTPLPTVGAPVPRDTHTAVWTGADMIVWGGTDSVSTFADGARFNPASGAWTMLPAAGQPVGRKYHTAVWSGSEMIVWGGLGSSNEILSDGGRYQAQGNAWQAMPGAPLARWAHTAVWTGAEMIVWGGNNNVAQAGGARYTPGGAWTTLSATGAPGARAFHTAVWTGAEMIVWGGSAGSGGLATGGRYAAASDTWLAFAPTNLPGRQYHAAVWTGGEMIVWGGAGSGSTFFNTGARYAPGAASWTLLPAAPGSVGGRKSHTAVWTGAEMIVWGGDNGSNNLDNGARYSSTTISWNSLGGDNSPLGTLLGRAVWTGSEMIVWGGNTNLGPVPYQGGRFIPATNTWRLMSLTNCPIARFAHTMIWTGSEAVVWGGDIFTSTTKTGGRYNPAADQWATVSQAGAPDPRAYHTAVWTGSQMIVWGGTNNTSSATGSLNTGGRYDPALDSLNLPCWISTTTTDAPPARHIHTAVWTGECMVIYGGINPSVAQYDSGAKYQFNPATNTDSWSPIMSPAFGFGRYAHTAIWTGSEMLMWGGLAPGSVALSTGGRYLPGSGSGPGSWLPISEQNAPSGRHYAFAAWTGARMIIWGGRDPGPPTYFNTGGVWDPNTDTWTTMALGPSGRDRGSSVWTGTEFIIFGGERSPGGVPATETWSYSPSRTLFLYQRP